MGVPYSRYTLVAETDLAHNIMHAVLPLPGIICSREQIIMIRLVHVSRSLVSGRYTATLKMMTHARKGNLNYAELKLNKLS